MTETTQKGSKGQAYDGTIAKWSEVLATAPGLISQEAWGELDELFFRLRDYGSCSYCVRYRAVLDRKHVPGACKGCPVHAYGERRANRSLAYNGCYQVPEYEQMVRRAVEYHNNPSRMQAEDVVSALQAVMAVFVRDRALFLMDEA